MYTVKLSAKARHLRISIHPGGEVIVTVPKNTHSDVVENFLKAKQAWIHAKVEVMKRYPKITKTTLSKKEVAILKQKTHMFVEEKLRQFNTHYRYSWNAVRIRAQKTRWGSCSKKGNLNFNYRISLLPDNLAEYIVVHELCHLGEFNHSQRFWDLVSQTIPDYKRRRKDLQTNGILFQ